MKLADLLEPVSALEIKADVRTDIRSIQYDSRRVGPGDVFVAIEGFETDGHKYIQNALDAGAAAVICQRPPNAEIPYVRVEDSRKALALMAAEYYGRPAEKMTVIGITGTNGKTTSTLLLKHVLEKCLDAKVGLVGTNGNMIGDREMDAERTTPESLELHALFADMLAAGCSHVVMEVSSHALALSRVFGIPFQVGVYTNLSQDHLDFHTDMDDYAAAKAMLFRQCGHAVINLDDAYSDRMCAAASAVTTYAIDKNEADLVAKDIRLGAGNVKFSALSTDRLQRVELQIPGRFTVYNALAVLGAALALGIGLSDASEALSTAKGVKGRVEVVETGRDFTILIDYAHTPDALENVLNAVRGFAPGRVVVLFGCGGDRDAKKRPLMGEIAVRLADFAVVTSDNPRTEDPGAIIKEILTGMEDTKTPYIVIEDRREAIAWALDHAEPDDVVILAGKGHETYQIVGHEKTHMDEREIIRDHLAFSEHVTGGDRQRRGSNE